jgi:uncharacterized protein
MIDILFPAALAVVAILYSTVGQAGGTGYVALLHAGHHQADRAVAKRVGVGHWLRSVLSFGSAHMAERLSVRRPWPAVLIARRSHTSRSVRVPADRRGLLLVAGLQMARSALAPKALDHVAPAAPPFLGSLLVGGIIGLVSGVTGVGGGIFLAPLVLTLGWATTRQTAAISAVFNLVNSASALAGAWGTLPLLPARLPVWLACVGFGGLLGSWMGGLHLNPRTLRLLLAFLLLTAAGRMIAVSI